MSWNYVRLGDVCSKIGSGATPKGGATVYIDSGIRLIRSQNVYNLEFSYDGLAHITEDAAEKLNGVTVLKNDVLLNITGDSVARTCIVPESVLPARVNQHVAIVRPNQEEVNPLFLNYYLASPYMQSFMLGLAVGKGASRNAMTKDMIANFEVPCPPIDIQESIVSILSAYDNLIENNQKQIKLLKEAAQRVYKEWFIDLRFPGYEYTVIVDGVPEGWKKVGLASIAPIVTGKKDANFGTADGKYLFFTCAQEPIKAPSYSFDCDAVILAGNGDFNIKLYRGQFEAYQRTYVFSPYDKDHLYLLYHAVRESMRQLFQGASGSTIKFLTKHMLEDILVHIPEDSILQAYNSNSEAIQKKIECLKNQIISSQEARDRLLPKLMSGEIEVQEVLV